MPDIYDILKIKNEQGDWITVPALKGGDGFAPAVTIQSIPGGHRVTITDAEHPDEGQSFDIMDGSDADVTAENIEAALGYTPADDDDVTTLESTVASQSSQIASLQSDLTAETARANAAEAALEAENERQNKEIEFIKEASEGVTLHIENSSSTNYEKAIPSYTNGTAKLADVLKIGGKTEVKNQLVSNPNFVSSSGWGAQRGTLSVANNIATYRATEVGTENQNRLTTSIGGQVIANNKYLLSCYINSKFSKAVLGLAGNWAYNISVTPNAWSFASVIISITNATGDLANYGVDMSSGAGAIGDEVLFKNCNLVNLTLRFGAGSEPSSVDDERIKLIERELDADPSFVGSELISAEVTDVVSRGKNLLNQNDLTNKGKWYSASTGALENNNNWCAYLIPVIGGQSYTISGLGTNTAGVPWLDSNMNFISSISRGNRIITAPENARYLGFSWVWNQESPAYDGLAIQIELGSSATSYSPYWADSLTIPQALLTFLADKGYGQSNGAEANTVDFVSKVYHKKGYYNSSDVWVADAQDIDISSYLEGFDTLLKAENGGSLTFEQEDTYIAVPNTENIYYKLGGA